MGREKDRRLKIWRNRKETLHWMSRKIMRIPTDGSMNHFYFIFLIISLYFSFILYDRAGKEK